MNVKLLVASALVAAALAPTAGAIEPFLYACVKGVNAPDCSDHSDVCVTGFHWVPQCADARCYPVGECVAPAMCADCVPPLVGVCVAGVTAPGCYDGQDACVGFSYQVPFCVDLPDVSCAEPFCPPPVTTDPTVQCTVLVAVGPVGGVCWVNGKQIGPIVTCEACLPAFYVVCTAGTEDVRCWSGGIDALS